MASIRCSVIVSSGHSKSATGTVSVADATPAAKPGAGVDDPEVTRAVPLTEQVQPRTVDVPDTVKSTLDGCAAAGDPASNRRPAATTATNRTRKRVQDAACILEILRLPGRDATLTLRGCALTGYRAGRRPD